MSAIAALQASLETLRAAVHSDDLELAASLMADYEHALLQLRASAEEAAALAMLKRDHDALIDHVRRGRDATSDALRDLSQSRRQRNAYQRQLG